MIGRLLTSLAANRWASSGQVTAGSQPDSGSWLPVTTKDGIRWRARRSRPSRKATWARSVRLAPSKTSPATSTASMCSARARSTIRSQLRNVASRRALAIRSGTAWPRPRNGLSRCRSPVWTNRSPTPSANLEDPEPDPTRGDHDFNGVTGGPADQGRTDRGDVGDLVGPGAGFGGPHDLEGGGLEGARGVHPLHDDR